MMKRRLPLGVLLLALMAFTGCEPGELSPALPVGGAIPASGSAPAVRPLPAAPPNQKMLQNPEGDLQDNGIEVVAQNDMQAQNKCEELARNQSDANTIVRCLGCRKRTKTTGKYICTLRTEVVLVPGENNP